jgi:hypothetical protein
MRIQLKKGRDGPATLACVRADGSRTWGNEHPFFPVHDLTHCAVESVLGFDTAFFGLIATGWEIDDFAKPGARRRMPFQAIIAEHVVGVLDRERGLPAPLTVAEFNETMGASLPPAQRDAFRPLSDAQLSQVRALRNALEARWYALSAGSTLEVEFPALERFA